MVQWFVKARFALLFWWIGLPTFHYIISMWIYCYQYTVQKFLFAFLPFKLCLIWLKRAHILCPWPYRRISIAEAGVSKSHSEWTQCLMILIWHTKKKKKLHWTLCIYVLDSVRYLTLLNCANPNMGTLTEQIA